MVSDEVFPRMIMAHSSWTYGFRRAKQELKETSKETFGGRQSQGQDEGREESELHGCLLMGWRC
jgi:hypothetical protein